MDEWAELDRALGAMQASGRAEIHEDGEWLAEFSSLRCEVRRSGKDSLVHLWSGERNLTRRVLRIRERSDDRIVLDVQRFGRPRPGRLEFLRTDSARSAARISREQFRARLHRILAERFPDSEVDSLTSAADLEHSFSGLYVRGRMREGSHAWALLAASRGASAAAIEGMLAFGILWLDWTRAHANRHAVEGLRLFVPAGSSRVLRERVLALSSSAQTEVFEFQEPDWQVQKTDPADSGNLESWLAPHRDCESAMRMAHEAAGRVPVLADESSEAARNTQYRVLPGAREVALCFRGLEFARWSKDGVRFGLGDSRENLTTSREAALERLLQRLDLHRNSHSSELSNALYRLAPERWLESLLIEDPTRLDALLEPRYLYSQVPAMTAGDRGVVDLLAVTRRGRLVVIELKASEDIQLPIQAVDYWLRVRRHQREGDFTRYGYFAGCEIDPAPPLLWLAGPSLRFHSTIGTLLKYLSPEIQVTRIGLNENWRRGIKVVFRQ